MPKALLFTTDFAPSSGGGICTHSRFIVESLIPHGWEFVVLSEYYIHSSDESIKQYSEKHGYPIYKLPASPSVISLIRKAFFCLKVARKHKPDLIIGSGRHTTWFAALVSFFTRVPLVTIGHGTEFTQVTSKYDLRINRWAYGRSKLLIAISEHTKSIVEKSGIKPRRIEVIHNAADENFFRMLDPEAIDSFKKRKGISDKRIILTVGSLSERKGQKVVIRALPQVKKNIPNILYVAIGNPALKDEFLQLAKELNIEDNVLFPGLIDEVELLNWINACDIFTMTSVNFKGDYEGYGIAVIEAALCGKTSVVSANAGLKEAVQNGRTGIVVKEGDETETAEAYLKLYQNPELLLTLSTNARLNALSHNTHHSVGKRYNDLMIEELHL